MLACARSDENLECVKSLLQFGANFECLDEFGNNVLHIAAMNGNNKIIDYLSKNLKIGIFARNKNGESALSICETLNNDEGSKILQKYMEEYDTSKSKVIQEGDEQVHTSDARLRKIRWESWMR